MEYLWIRNDWKEHRIKSIKIKQLKRLKSCVYFYPFFLKMDSASHPISMKLIWFFQTQNQSLCTILNSRPNQSIWFVRWMQSRRIRKCISSCNNEDRNNNRTGRKHVRYVCIQFMPNSPCFSTLQSLISVHHGPDFLWTIRPSLFYVTDVYLRKSCCKECVDVLRTHVGLLKMSTVIYISSKKYFTYSTSKYSRCKIYLFHNQLCFYGGSYFIPVLKRPTNLLFLVLRIWDFV